MARQYVLMCVAVVVCAAAAPALATPLYNHSVVVMTPWGRHFAACVHEVPDGAVVDNEATHLVVSHESYDQPRKIPRCGLRWPAASAGGFDDDDANGDGWQAYTQQKVQGEVTAMLGSWTVPPEPQQEAQVGVHVRCAASCGIVWASPLRVADLVHFHRAAEHQLVRFSMWWWWWWWGVCVCVGGCVAACARKCVCQATV